ncbi:MAG: hypothetical protein VZS44_01770 [Bacilli bacterium]|nr:hypothetical protein [Bacilli bacterium]
MNNSKLKRLLLLIVLSLIFFPYNVKAQEKCTIVSGSGKDIGNEIACGTEHFYIIDNKDDKLKMIAKYNLYVGNIYNKIKLDITKTYIRYECTSSDSCSSNATYFFEGEQVNSYDEWKSRILSKHNLSEIYEIGMNNGENPSNGNIALYDYIYSDKYTENDKTYINKTFKFYPYTSITEETEGYALQNELALGVTGEKGNANYPIYSTLNLFFREGTDRNNIENYDNFSNGYTNFQFKENTNIKKYLKDYKDNLNNMGYEITNVDIINIKELNDLVYSISNKNLPLTEWYNNPENPESITEDNNTYHILGDLKGYVSNDYSWLWSTSYWTRTLFGNRSESEPSTTENYVYFVSTSGEICYSKSNCFSGIPRAGLRPIVTISQEKIKYNIYTKTDGNGTIEVVESAYGGNTISFKVSSKKGYKLNKLTITTASNEIIEFNQEDITQDESGDYIITTNIFTMPYENVTIEASWSKDDNNIIETIVNPKTGVNKYLFISIIMLISIITIIITKRKETTV